MNSNKKKYCFVIMPISDKEGYNSGHFSEVYEDLIKPACKYAGFTPIRADEVSSTNFIALDVIKKLVETEMAICDLSSQSPNVLYELGIRQAFNLPVTLIKDNRTSRVFDIQGIRDYEYDESLRVKTTKLDIIKIGDVIKETYKKRESNINSLISLLGITVNNEIKETKITTDTEIILHQLKSIGKRMGDLEYNYRRGQIGHKVLVDEKWRDEFKKRNVSKEYMNIEEIGNLKIGDEVAHDYFGLGKVNALSLKDDVDNSVISINFTEGIKEFKFHSCHFKKLIKQYN